MRWLPILCLYLTGCASLFSTTPDALRIKDVDWPLAEIRSTAAQLLPAGQRAVSPNGRELLSRHYIVKGDKFLPAGDATQRYYAHILILGDRRPYDVEVVVIHEKRVQRGERYIYVRVGPDETRTLDLEQRLRRELTKRREERNIIDDFRVY